MQKDRIKMPGGGGDKGHQILSFGQNFGGDRNSFNQSKKFTLARFKAFTLAEVLITLAIIGVVSAIVIPTVIKNYNDKKYNAARLKALKTFGEAGKMASINEEINGQETATDFVNNVLSKYLKITKTCTLQNSEDCGFPNQIQTMCPSSYCKYRKTSDYSRWNNNLGMLGATTLTQLSATNLTTVISTVDGFSAIIFYNPNCVRNSKEAPWAGQACNKKECKISNIDSVCMNIIYDMNGTKKPNHVSEDIGIVTVFWSGPKAIAVAPGIIPYSVNTTGTTTATFADATSVCANKSTSRIKYTLPNIDEVVSLAMNYYLTWAGSDAWSGSAVADMPGYAWYAFHDGGRGYARVTGTANVWCVRR